MGLLRRLRALSSYPKSRKRGQGFRTYQPRLEPLEERTLLTTTLYIDYGDRFPGGVLNTTVGEIDSTTFGSNPDIDGPELLDSNLAPYAATTTVAIHSLTDLYPTDAPSMRATMNALVRRFFEPLDVTVVDLTSSFQDVNGHIVRAAASLDDISQTLGSNEGDPKNNDCYIIVGQFLIGSNNDNPILFQQNAYGGRATVADIGGNNNTDGTAIVCLIGAGDDSVFSGENIAHEAGHLLGLFHAYRQDVDQPPPVGFGPQYDILHQSELMSYLSYGGGPFSSANGFDFFSRYPTMLGDGNVDVNLLSNAPSPFEQMLYDPNIGPSGITYVTGTGANDVITILKSGTNSATVSIQAFFDPGYATAIDAPGATGTSYVYTISLDKPLLVDAGDRNDLIRIMGALGTTITVRGMHGTDSLMVRGDGTGSATYVPAPGMNVGLDGNADLRGTIVAGNTVVNFQELEGDSQVTVEGFASLNLRTPSGADTLMVDQPTAGTNRLSGTSGSTSLIPLAFSAVTTVALDARSNHTAFADDIITVAATGLSALGLKSFTIMTGDGNNTIVLNAGRLALPVDGGRFALVGGAGQDTLVASADVGFGLRDGILTSTGGGSVWLSSFEIAALSGGPSNNVFGIGQWSGVATMDGAGGQNTLVSTIRGNRTWHVQGPGSGSVNATGPFFFQNFHSLRGGPGKDLFQLAFSSSGSALAIDGSGALNELLAPDMPLLWRVTASNRGYLQALNTVFSNVHNLTAGSAGDIFRFSGAGALAGMIRAGGGTNWLDYSEVRQGVAVNLSRRTASRVGRGVIGIHHVIGSARGGDRLVSTMQGSVLVAHGNNNQLRSAGGRSLIVGGFGRNDISGGRGQDILIAGRTVFDNDYAALESILATWKGPGSYSDHIAALRGGPNRLVIGETVFLERGVNGGRGPRFGRHAGSRYESILKGQAGQDWFFAARARMIVDRKADEQVD